MKKFLLSLLSYIITININSQTSTVTFPNPNDTRVITTGVPFLLIASDARAASMGDMVLLHLLMCIRSFGIHQNMYSLRLNLDSDLAIHPI